ncbi:hypothetical protein ABZ697_31395 [Streptomyces albidoflavus]|uniref:hypothetical protein n=1 Tax=Streptomyces albidoflavus TaxID=1886 RepID=UPI0033F987DC
MRIRRYEAEVDIRTTDGQEVTLRGEGLGPDGEAPTALLDGLEAAAVAQEPGAEVIASRARRA